MESSRLPRDLRGVLAKCRRVLAALPHVRPARVTECPIQMEARVLSLHEMGGAKLKKLGGGIVAIVEVLRVHADESFLQEGSDHIDPAKWSPLVYNFRHTVDLSDHELGKTFRSES